MNLTDRFDQLVAGGLRPFEAGRELGLTKGQTSRAWNRVKARHSPIPRHTVSRNIDDGQVQYLSAPRDPCPRCGARGDYACGHAPVQGGRLVCL